MESLMLTPAFYPPDLHQLLVVLQVNVISTLRHTLTLNGHTRIRLFWRYDS